jgi:hypothetical protein
MKLYKYCIAIFLFLFIMIYSCKEGCRMRFEYLNSISLNKNGIHVDVYTHDNSFKIEQIITNKILDSKQKTIDSLIIEGFNIEDSMWSYAYPCMEYIKCLEYKKLYPKVECKCDKNDRDC